MLKILGFTLLFVLNFYFINKVSKVNRLQETNLTTIFLKGPPPPEFLTDAHRSLKPFIEDQALNVSLRLRWHLYLKYKAKFHVY